VLQGYFDDSGSDAQRSPFVLAGFILPAQQWEAFSDEWQQECDKEPRIKYLKMSQAAYGVNEFSFCSELRQSKIRSLAALVPKYALHGIETFLRWEEFRTFNAGLVGPAKDQPFAPLFFRIIENVLNYQKALGLFPSKIQLDFDEQGKAGRFAIRNYELLMDEVQEHRVPDEFRDILEGTPRMLDDKKYPGLQAADMLAWSIRRQMDDPEEAKGSPFGWLYEELRKNVWPGCKGFGAVNWENIAERVRSVK
jgi:hypothetical protein